MILAIQRAPRFSPNSEKKDAEILANVCQLLLAEGFQTKTVCEEDAYGWEKQDWECVLTMGRLPEVLRNLHEMQSRGTTVINSSQSIALCCNRHQLTEKLKEQDIPIPPCHGHNGYWLKRGDGVAQSRRDVRFAADETEKERVWKEMQDEGITDIVTQAHITGDLVKFYGVRNSDFFSVFYPSDDGMSKFGDEQRNGKAHHYPYDENLLHQTAERAAQATGTDIYGGDAVIKADGTFFIIDFNDWPSFSRCRQQATEAIVSMVAQRIRRKTEHTTSNY